MSLFWSGGWRPKLLRFGIDISNKKLLSHLFTCRRLTARSPRFGLSTTNPDWVRALASGSTSSGRFASNEPDLTKHFLQLYFFLLFLWIRRNYNFCSSCYTVVHGGHYMFVAHQNTKWQICLLTLLEQT
jgi:hypothetical protein